MALEQLSVAIKQLVIAGTYSMYNVAGADGASFVLMTPERTACCNPHSQRKYYLLDNAGKILKQVDGLGGLTLGKPSYLQPGFNAAEVKAALVEIKNRG